MAPSTSSAPASGSNASHYPLEGATPKTYYLGPGKSLGPTKPGASGGSDPLVWTGASSPCGRSTEQWGAGLLQLVLEQADGDDPCAGDDSSTQVGPGAATYTTAPLQSPKVLAGPIDATLYASSNRPDTEFVVNVEDVAPNGKSTPLTSGALLGSFRKLDRIADVVGERRKAADALPRLHARLQAARSDRPDDPLRHRGIPDLRQARRRPPAAGHDHHLRRPASAAHAGPDRPTWPAASTRSSTTASAASFLELPLAPASAFTKACGICR